MSRHGLDIEFAKTQLENFFIARPLILQKKFREKLLELKRKF